MDATTQERNVALRFRAWRSCLPKTKPGPDGFLAFEFKNSSHLGQLLLRLCIPPRLLWGRWCQSAVEYIQELIPSSVLRPWPAYLSREDTLAKGEAFRPPSNHPRSECSQDASTVRQEQTLLLQSWTLRANLNLSTTNFWISLLEDSVFMFCR